MITRYLVSRHPEREMWPRPSVGGAPIVIALRCGDSVDSRTNPEQ